MNQPRTLLIDTHVAALRLIKSLQPCNPLDPVLNAFPGTIRDLRNCGFCCINESTRLLSVTSDGEVMLKSFEAQDLERGKVGPQASKPQTSIADIIKAVSQRSISMDQERKRIMSSMQLELGLSSLDDVLVVALHITRTILDLLPSNGLLQIVKEDGTIEKLKITN